MNMFSTIAAIFVRSLIIISCSYFLSACEQKENSKEQNLHDPNYKIEDEADAYLVSNYLWQQGLFALETLHQQVLNLKQQSELFLLNPSSELLNDTYKEWKKTHILYEQFAPFLYLDNSSIAPKMEKWRNKIAPLPILPGYLDSIGIYKQSGIVNDISFPISKSSLKNQHQLTDSEEITLGLYAIEFILLGDGSTTHSLDSTVKRFTKLNALPDALSQSELIVSELPNNRRRIILSLQINNLIENLELIQRQWKKNGELHTTFSSLSATERLLSFYNGFLLILQQNNATIASLIEATESELSINDTYEKRERFNALIAIEQHTAVIDSICCKTIIEESKTEDIGTNVISDNKPPLFSDILSESDKKNLLVILYDIKKQLNQR